MIDPLSLDLDIRTYERAAFSAVRQLRDHRIDWGECIAAAERIIAEAEEASQDETEALFEGSWTTPLIGAARILDSASRPESALSSDDRKLLAIEASTAYAMSGNFPSAYAVTREWLGRDTELLSAYASLLVFLVPDFMVSQIPTTADSRIQDLEATLLNFLRTGQQRDFDSTLDSWRILSVAANTPHLSAALRAGRVALYQLRRLSTVLNLRPFATRLPRFYLNNLFDDGKWALLPSQYMAVKRGILSNNDNLIFAFPTSAGKTLMGELCLCNAIEREPGLVAFIAPYQVLARQVHSSIRKHLGTQAQVELLIGGYRPVEELDPAARPTFIIATPERFDAMLRGRPDYMEHLKAVVFDEAHIVEQSGRGTLVEGLVTRLKLQQARLGRPRLTLLSAVITSDSLARFRTWLGVTENGTVTTDWRPTARRLAIWQQSGKLVYFGVGDPLTFDAEPSGIIGQKNLPWPNPWVPATTHFGQIRAAEPHLFNNVAYLCRQLYDEHHEPILCICATRATTRKLALELSRGFPAREPLPAIIAKTVETIDQIYPHLAALRQTLLKGIAYHNASLPNEVRVSIEEASKNAELVAICATTTLAEGVDLPFRFTVLVDWLSWHDGVLTPMSGVLFRNIAGRCGRARYYTEGDTIIIDNPLGYREHPTLRVGEIRRHLVSGSGATLGSSLESLASELSGSVRSRIEAQLESQFIAAIPENPDANDLRTLFAEALLVSVRGVPPQVAHATRSAESRLLSGDQPIASSASPLQLTEFGRSCLTTGLSSDSCRALAAWVEAAEHAEDTNEISAELLWASANFPEAPSLVSKIYQRRSRAPVAPDDVGNVIAMWRTGNRPEAIFASLPKVIRSRREPTLEAWLSGTSLTTTWDDYYEVFLDFLNGGLQNWLAWIATAVGRLSSSLPNQLAPIDWATLALELEQGVDSRWALAKMGEIPVPRWALAPFGRALERAAEEQGETVDNLLAQGASIDSVIQSAMTDANVVAPARPEDFARLKSWLIGTT